jgi:DNA primase
MHFDQLKIVLAKLGVNTENLYPSSPEQVQICCPLAPWLHKSKTDKHPSLSIKFGEPPTLYKCFACHEGGKLWQLVDSYGYLAKKPALRQLAGTLAATDEPSITSRLETIAESFDEWVFEKGRTIPSRLHDSILNNFPPAWGFPRARTYLQRRRVTLEMSEYWDLRYDPKNARIMFPVRNREGDLIGGVGRTTLPGFEPRYFNYFGFSAASTLGGVSHFAPSLRIGVAEGFFDLINCHAWARSHGIDLSCTWKAETSPEQCELLLSYDRPLIYFYDFDEAGNKGWAKAKQAMSKVAFGMRRAKWQNDSLDLGGMDQLEFGLAVSAAKLGS